MALKSKEAHLNFRLTTEELAVIDAYRGLWSRSQYIRQALFQAKRNKLKGPREDQEGPGQS